jgi:hypothetical protein
MCSAELKIKTMIDNNKDYSKINADREMRAKALHIGDVSVSYLSEGKTCDTCIFWKRYMLRTFPNATYLGAKFPCSEPNFVQNATFGEQNKKKNKHDSCERWQYER